MAASTLPPSFSAIHASSTVEFVSTYVPAFATSTTFYASHIGGSTPTSTTTAHLANPTVPAFSNDLEWVTAYLTVHSLSRNSYVYMYVLWMAIAASVLALSIATWTGMRSSALGARWVKWALRRRTWRKKHALRQAALEAKRKGLPPGTAHKQPWSLPSNAQLLAAGVLSVIVAILCVVGPDYIDPDLDILGSRTTFINLNAAPAPSVTKRAVTIDPTIFSFFVPRYSINKSFWSSAARFGDVAFALFPLVILLALKAAPFALFAIPGLVGFNHDKTIRLHRWVGLLIWLVTVVHVILWLIQLFRDIRAGTGELVIHYVWIYPKFRYAWIAFIALTLLVFSTFSCFRSRHYEIFYAMHIILTPVVLIFAALHHPPIWQWCWAALALWLGERAWRATWWLYVNGVFSKEVTSRKASKIANVVQPSAEEKESVMRRPTKSVMSTATVVGASESYNKDPFNEGKEGGAWEMHALRNSIPSHPHSGLTYEDRCGSEQDNVKDGKDYASVYSTGSSNTNLSYVGPPRGPGNATPVGAPGDGSANSSPSFSCSPSYPLMPAIARPTLGSDSLPRSKVVSVASSLWQLQASVQKDKSPSYAPPAGYAHATLLPGRTVRLRLVTPGYKAWAPGQHFLVNLPAISRFTSHPFSIASVCDEQATPRTERNAPDADEGEKGQLVQVETGREIVLLIRVKKGWTMRLWELVSDMQSEGVHLPPGESLPSGSATPPPNTPGIILRAFIDGPFGSSARTHWGRYSSVLIVAGGSGVSFGLSVLEYICLCLAGRDGRFLGGHSGGWGVGKKDSWVCQRVRFIWLVREYAHIQWCAGTLRRCAEVIPTNALEINIFVTNFRPQKEIPMDNADLAMGLIGDGDDLVAPPTSRFAERGSKRASASGDSISSDVSVDSIVDMYGGFEGGDGIAERESELGHELHELDYTNFDGDDDTPLPGESRLSRHLIKEGKLRRAITRKATKAMDAKRKLEERAAVNFSASAANNNVNAKHLSHLSDVPSVVSDERESKHASALSTDMLLSPLSVTPTSATSHSVPWNQIERQPSTLAVTVPPPSVLHAHHQMPHGPLSPDRERDAFSITSPNTALESLLSGNAQGHGHDPSRVASSPFQPMALLPGTALPATAGPSVRWNDESANSSSVIVKPSKHDRRFGEAFALDDEESRDLQIVSEWARPGKPKLGRILSDEIEASNDRVVVACCGPTSLNTLVRKLIAERIDPARVARGDMRGMVDFVAEDFEY